MNFAIWSKKSDFKGCGKAAEEGTALVQVVLCQWSAAAGDMDKREINGSVTAS